jgi:hypothetical protein
MLAALPFCVITYVVLSATVSAVLFYEYGNEQPTSPVPVWANALGLLSLCATLFGSAVSGNFRCAANGFVALIASNMMAFTVTLVAQEDGPSAPIVHVVRTLTPWLTTALLVGMALTVMFLLDAGESPFRNWTQLPTKARLPANEPCERDKKPRKGGVFRPESWRLLAVGWSGRLVGRCGDFLAQRILRQDFLFQGRTVEPRDFDEFAACFEILVTDDGSERSPAEQFHYCANGIRLRHASGLLPIQGNDC